MNETPPTIEPAFDPDVEFRGKNPKRVAGQLRRQMKIQKQRIYAQWSVFAFCALLPIADYALELTSFTFSIIARVTCWIILPICFISAICEYGVLKNQRKRLARMNEYLDGHAKPRP